MANEEHLARPRTGVDAWNAWRKEHPDIAPDLRGADLAKAHLYETIFVNADLSATKGLDACTHYGPSVLDHRTLQQSGRLPLAFLHGCGLPDRLIDYLPSLLDEAIQYYSCFISYSTKDEAFTNRLYADLQNNGVRCWFAPEDMKIGDKFRQRIDEAIHVHEAKSDSRLIPRS